MIDRIKVIKGFVCCTTYDENGSPLCEACPYSDGKYTCDDMRVMMREALVLLTVGKEATKSDRKAAGQEI